MIVAKIESGLDTYWTDRDHFIHGDNWYRVVALKNKGRVLGELFWLDVAVGEVHRSIVLTEAGFAASRPVVSIGYMDGEESR